MSYFLVVQLLKKIQIFFKTFYALRNVYHQGYVVFNLFFLTFFISVLCILYSQKKKRYLIIATVSYLDFLQIWCHTFHRHRACFHNTVCRLYTHDVFDGTDDRQSPDSIFRQDTFFYPNILRPIPQHCVRDVYRLPKLEMGIHITFLKQINGKSILVWRLIFQSAWYLEKSFTDGKFSCGITFLTQYNW